MTSNEMIKRTKQFAVDCGFLILPLEANVVNRAYSAQLISFFLKMIVASLKTLRKK